MFNLMERDLKGCQRGFSTRKDTSKSTRRALVNLRPAIAYRKHGEEWRDVRTQERIPRGGGTLSHAP